MCLWLTPNLVFGYGATGHARQQLRLLAADIIAEVLDLSAARLTLPELPLTLLDNEAPRLSSQLDVLVAEGLVRSDPVLGETRTLTPVGWVMRATSGQRYFLPPGKSGDAIHFGQADLNRVGEVRLDHQPDGETVAVIFFTWEVKALEEWVWAPAFDGDRRLSRIKSSQQNPISGRAELVWRQNRWQLKSVNLFYD